MHQPRAEISRYAHSKEISPRATFFAMINSQVNFFRLHCLQIHTIYGFDREKTFFFSSGPVECVLLAFGTFHIDIFVLVQIDFINEICAQVFVCECEYFFLFILPLSVGWPHLNILMMQMSVLLSLSLSSPSSSFKHEMWKCFAWCASKLHHQQNQT